MAREPLHLAVALDGAGWHPAAWREPEARPRELFTAGYWTDLVQEAERGALDFVTIEDGFAQQSTRYHEPDGRTDQVRGRLDAALIAARVAPRTRHIGLVPTVVATHTEPFHISKSIATLDYVSRGRAGLRVQISGRLHEATLFGRREFVPVEFTKLDDPAIRAQVADLFDEAADHVEVVRRLWDSWEDDAEIRDAATGRFIDRDKLHYIDFAGRWFSVKGPSITQRPPQGQPVVVSLAHSAIPYRLAARAADVVFVTPKERAEAAGLVEQVRAAEAEVGRAEPLRVWADLVVFLADGATEAAERRARLEERAGAAYTSDTGVFTGTPAELAEVLLAHQDAGFTGFRLRPATLPHDLTAITRGLVPELRARGVFRDEYRADTLRGLLGLARPANRYAA